MIENIVRLIDLRSAGALASLFVCLCLFALFPPALLTSEAGIGSRFLLLLGIPIFIATIDLIYSSISYSNRLIQAGISSFSAGVSAAYGVFSLIVLHAWYVNPGNGKMEPLLVLLGIASGGVELSRRKMSKSKSADNDSKSDD